MKLKQLIFGSSERSAQVLDRKDTTNPVADEAVQSKPQAKKRAPGHGRNGANEYPGAIRHAVDHPQLKKGDICPECGRGHLFRRKNSGIAVRIKGSSPLTAEIWELETLRCSGCQATFKADLPPEAGTKKIDEAGTAIMAMLKYGSGMPFWRLKNLQQDVGVPVPASTQYEILRDLSLELLPVYGEILWQAAQGELIHNDDTPVRIIEIAKSIKENGGSRKGIFTTGIVSRYEGHDLALYFSGRNHAGENLEKLLGHRNSGLPPPIQMCDALLRNTSAAFVTILANCLAHGRRYFVDLIHIFPNECRHVIETLGEVYHHDQITKNKQMTPQERLLFHQENSKPKMDDLKKWFSMQFKQKLVEPNSTLGKAIKYMQNHWEKLTLFLRVPGAPLDNNICERALKMAILNRKNAFFYKTKNGARVGDILMSIIQTARLAKINVLDYLKNLQIYKDNVNIAVNKWLPWNYQTALKALKNQEG